MASRLLDVRTAALARKESPEQITARMGDAIDEHVKKCTNDAKDALKEHLDMELAQVVTRARRDAAEVATLTVETMPVSVCFPNGDRDYMLPQFNTIGEECIPMATMMLLQKVKQMDVELQSVRQQLAFVKTDYETLKNSRDTMALSQIDSVGEPLKSLKRKVAEVDGDDDVPLYRSDCFPKTDIVDLVTGGKSKFSTIVPNPKIEFSVWFTYSSVHSEVMIFMRGEDDATCDTLMLICDSYKLQGVAMKGAKNTVFMTIRSGLHAQKIVNECTRTINVKNHNIRDKADTLLAEHGLAPELIVQHNACKLTVKGKSVDYMGGFLLSVFTCEYIADDHYEVDVPDEEKKAAVITDLQELANEWGYKFSAIDA